mmetsp:Transcript_4328/g.13119  ORF Transcript_4328/g.13119 Transcript_4328/m.13119 type:complete len:322 (-) Transcript_4328:867-1832(-)
MATNQGRAEQDRTYASVCCVSVSSQLVALPFELKVLKGCEEQILIDLPSQGQRCTPKTSMTLIKILTSETWRSRLEPGMLPTASRQPQSWSHCWKTDPSRETDEKTSRRCERTSRRKFRQACSSCAGGLAAGARLWCAHRRAAMLQSRTCFAKEVPKSVGSWSTSSNLTEGGPRARGAASSATHAREVLPPMSRGAVFCKPAASSAKEACTSGSSARAKCRWPKRERQTMHSASTNLLPSGSIFNVTTTFAAMMLPCSSACRAAMSSALRCKSVCTRSVRKSVPACTCRASSSKVHRASTLIETSVEARTKDKLPMQVTSR